MDTESPTTPGQSSSVRQYLQTGAPLPLSVALLSESYPSGSLVDWKALFDARLEATGEELKQIDLIVDFIEWISESEFLRSQQPEPLVGGSSSNCPPTVEQQGIKGHSIYTALFHHLDMEIFSCKLCPHVVKEDFELAILHQRVVHFDHYPYQCSTTQYQWYVPFLLPCGSVSSIHFDSAGYALQTKRGWSNTSSPWDTRWIR